MAATEVFENTAKRKMLSGELALGLIVRSVRSPEAAFLAKASGHDFIFLDTQHALFDPETIAGITLAAIGAGITPLVRVRGSGDPDIPRLLDAGVMGVIVPDVGDADEARAIVAACKFAPEGNRSLSLPSPLLGHRPVPAPEATRLMNENVLVVCMIETREGLRNAAEIAQVEGVDVLHVGCSDLLMGLGLPGQFEAPELAAAIRTVGDACRNAGKIAGLGGNRDVDRQRQAIAGGVRFLTTQADTNLLISAGSQLTAALRARP